MASDRTILVLLRNLVGPVMLGTLAAIAWWKAPQFDPYTMSFFTKTYVAPDAEMPGDMRTIGWIVIGIGGLVLAACINVLIQRKFPFRDVVASLVSALLVMAIGASFFAAADSAQRHIDLETAK